MKKTPAPSPAVAAELRERAKARLEDKKKAQAGQVATLLSTYETQRLLQELQIYQIELEMQNEDLRRIQGELEASRARYFDLYDLAPVGYFTLNGQGMILEINLAAAELLGASKAALIRQPLPHFILPEDQDIYYRHHKLLFETGAPQVYELRLVKKDAVPFWVRIDSTTAQNADAAPVCRTTMIDITDRKRAEAALQESEEQFRTIVNNMQDVVFRADPNGNITFVSTSAAYTLGCSSTEEMIGLRIGSDFYFDPKEAQHHLEMLQRCGKLTRQKITLKRRDNGQPVIVSANIQFFHDNAGNILGIEGVYSDITDRIQAEKEREKLIRELQQALKEVKKLSGMLPICASCKNIRDDEGYWKQIESYISAHSEAEFSHGICPDCLKKLYPDVYKKMQQDDKP